MVSYSGSLVLIAAEYQEGQSIVIGKTTELDILREN